MLCDFLDGKCSRCGVVREPPYPRRRCSPGLGDLVAAGLGFVGISKERAQSVAEAVGASDCGCSQRQQALNEWGYTVGIGTPPPAAPPPAPLP
jgi:hypothetical protein